MNVLHTSALLCLALMTGNEFCVAAFVEPILRSLPTEPQLACAPRVASLLGRFMPFWYALNLLLTVAVFISARRRFSAWPIACGIALVLQSLVLGLSVTVLVPRNNRLAGMTMAYTNWQVDAAQWDTLHRIRVMLLLAATVALAA